MIREIRLGDLSVLVQGELPATMWQALAAIASRAHAAYKEFSGSSETSHNKCLFMSLAVRDFLVQIGFRDATVRGCLMLVYANDLQGKIIWSVGVGVHDLELPDSFNGHAVCTVPSLHLLIDTTVYQAQRKHWPDLPGMVATTYHEPWSDQLIYDRPSLCAFTLTLDDRVVKVAWGDRPELDWRNSVDFRVKSKRRIFITKAMRAAMSDERDLRRAR